MNKILNRIDWLWNIMWWTDINIYINGVKHEKEELIDAP